MVLLSFRFNSPAQHQQVIPHDCSKMRTSGRARASGVNAAATQCHSKLLPNGAPCITTQ